MNRKWIKWRPAVLLILISFVATACANESSGKAGWSLIRTTNPEPVAIYDGDAALIRNIKKDLEQFDELYDIAVIKGKEDILVAYKVRHMKRFRMKKIEKNIKKLLNKKYLDEKFTISSDYKIFLEAVELKEKLKNPHYSRDQAEKQLKKIIKLKNEMT